MISPQAAGQKRCAATMDEKLLSLELAHTTPSKSKARILLAEEDDILKLMLTCRDVIPRIVDLKHRIAAEFWTRQRAGAIKHAMHTITDTLSSMAMDGMSS